MRITRTRLKQIIKEEVEISGSDRRAARRERIREKMRTVWNDQRFQSVLDAIAALGQAGVLGKHSQRAAMVASLASMGYELGIAREGDRDTDVTHTVTEVAVLLSAFGLASSVPSLEPHIEELTGGAAIASLVDIVSNIGNRETLERAVCANATESMAMVLQAIIDDESTMPEAQAVAESQLVDLNAIDLTEEECAALKKEIETT